MSADVSRVRFNALKDYAGVALQQGRLLLDADFNEFTDVVDRRLRAAVADLASPGPVTGISGVAVVPRTTPNGFAISAAGGKVTIGVGRMYVDGILVENHGVGAAGFDPLLTETVFADPTPFTSQPYQPVPDPVPGAGRYLAYLDVWQRELTPLQQPDLIEPAVGVDTTTRVQNVWQVKLFGGAGQGFGDDIGCGTPDEKIPGWAALIAPSDGRLTTRTVAVDDSLDPCYLPPTGGYRGLENQLYRVQVFTGGGLGTATFGWSRDNASVSSSVTTVLSPTSLQVASLGKDSVLRIGDDNWVEITDDYREFSQRCGELRKVTVDEATRTLTFSPPLPADLQPSGIGKDTPADRHLRVVRWDQARTVVRGDGTPLVDLDAAGSSGAVPIPADGAPVVLESGVAVSFSIAAVGGTLHPGDHWEFAARTADSSVELLTEAPPRGIHHHYARLGFVTLPDGSTGCRTLWPPICDGDGGDGCCECTVCVTPESHASESMTLQAAVDVVRGIGGTVCVKAGLYRLTEPVRLRNATSVRIRGQGGRTVLVADNGGFVLQGCTDCTLEEMAILEAGSAPAVSAVVTADVTLQRLIILAFAANREVFDRATVWTAAGGTGAGIGIALSGLNALLTVRENVIVAPIGISGGRGISQDQQQVEVAVIAAASRVAPVLAVDLVVRDNVLLCQLAGVDLVQNVVHALGAQIEDNDILGCGGWGIGATGVMVAGGAMRIDRNDLAVSGHGVITGASNARVTANDITGNTALGAGQTPDGSSAVGIMIMPSRPIAATGSAVVESNAITGVSGPGVYGIGAASVCRVERNLVRGSANGIVLALVGADVRAAGNQVLDLVAPNSGSTVGVGAAGASSWMAVDNVIDGLDPDGKSGATRTGIRAIACSDVHISRNQIRRATAGDDNAQATGIDIDGPFLSATVSQNLARPATAANGEPSIGALWVALRIDGPTKPTFTTVGAEVPGQTGPANEFMMLPMSTGSTTFAAVAGSAFVLDVSDRSGNTVIEGNTLYGSSKVASVQVSTPGAVVFSNNLVEHDLQQASGGPGVSLDGSRVIVQGNRVVGGRPSIEIASRRPFTALGNITTTPIEADGALGTPWDVLNILA